MRKALYFLGILDDSDIDWLIANGTKREVSPGTFLVEEGKPLDAVFLVIDGRLSVSAGALGGREIAQLMSGEVVGEMSFVDSNPPSASVRAIDRTFALSVPRTQLRMKLDSDSLFASRFYRAIAVFLADRLRSTVTTLGYGSDQVLQQDRVYADEIDPDTLENISLAGARFDWIQRKLRSV
jgi:CRP/FNR family transcriptional regulator, cyclic AMP receptor protein